MGVSDLMAALIKGIAKQFGPLKSKEEVDKIMDDVLKIQKGHAAFIRVLGMVACDCGHAVDILCSPPQYTEEEAKEMQESFPEDERPTVLISAPKDMTPEEREKAETVSASNCGHTVSVCEKCGRKYIVCWEMEAAQIDRNVTLPWDDPEVPDHPSSGPSPFPMMKGSDTVH